MEHGATIPAALLCQQAGKAVCVGRNFAPHVKELNNPMPSQPFFFTKTSNCFVPFSPSFVLPAAVHGPCHYELEIALVVGTELRPDNVAELSFTEQFSTVALAVDLTLRQLQTKLKDQGLPWTLAKSFDGACPLTDALPLDQIACESFSDLSLWLRINGQVRQTGSLSELIFPVQRLLEAVVPLMTLKPGDLLLTGTPAGVGPLQAGDTLEACLYIKQKGVETIEPLTDVPSNLLIAASSIVALA